MGIPAENFEIVGSYNNLRIGEIDSERSINCFEYRDPQGKKPKALQGTSGLLNSGFIFTGATSGFRGQFNFLGTMYLVIGTSAYKIEPNGTVVRLATNINGPSSYVGIDGNEFQVIFVDGQFGYVYDTISDVFVTITDPSFPVLPIDVTMLDEFAVVADGGTNNFQLSMFNQALVWGPDAATSAGNTFVATSGSSPNLVLTSGTTLNYQVGTPITFAVGSGGALPISSPVLVLGQVYFVKTVVNSTTFTISATDGGTAIVFTSTGTSVITLTNSGQLQLGSITSHSGTIVACRTLHRRLFLFSQFYTEVWENAGAGDNLPFRRNNAALLEYGTPAIGSIAVSFDRMFFLSQSRDGIGPFMLIEGSQAIPASNRALNSQLAIYSALNQVSDCRSFMIQENGIIFYRANFTAANHTFIYNATLSDPTGDDPAKLWHEEEDLYGNRHITQTHAYFNGINYSGSYNSPILYQVSAQYYSNDGQNIHRTRITRPVMNEGSNRRRVDRLFIDMLQGQNALAPPSPAASTFLATSGSSPNLVLSSGTTGSYVAGTPIKFAIGPNGVLPIASPALMSGQTYYVKSIVDRVTFTISATNGGSAIDFTTTGTAIVYAINVTAVTQEIPFVYLSISKDGGQSYGNQLVLPFGKLGQRTFRTIARKLGVIPRGQAFVCKVEFFAQVPFEILGSSWVTEILPE